MYKEILCNLINIRKAYKKAHRGKSLSPDVEEFDKDLVYNLNEIKRLLERKEWDKIFTYYRFYITEPKLRAVDAMHFRGRLVQHIICDEILKPYYNKRLIKENCACREGKGTEYASKLLEGYISNLDEFYALKMDIKHYFPSIDRFILKSLLADFPDKETRELLFWIIDHCPEENGIPIGNQTSQWFALLYLNEFDRLFKEVLGLKDYVRYMDDAICISKSKAELAIALIVATKYLKEKRQLKFNSKTQILKASNSISFLGWTYKNGVKRISKSKLPYRKRKIREAFKLFLMNKIDRQMFLDKLNSLLNNISRGNTFRLINSLFKKYNIFNNIIIAKLYESI